MRYTPAVSCGRWKWPSRFQGQCENTAFLHFDLNVIHVITGAQGFLGETEVERTFIKAAKRVKINRHFLSWAKKNIDITHMS